MFPRFLLPYYSETYPIKAATEKPEQSRYKLNFYQTIAMKSNSKNVVKATFRTATQLVAIMAVILVTLIACSKSDSEGSTDNKKLEENSGNKKLEESPDNKKLIGTWVWESATIDGKNVEDISFGGKKISDYFGDCFKKNKFVFTDKEVVFYEYAPLKTGLNQCKERFSTASYVFSGNTLVIKGEGGAGSINVSIVGNKATITDRVEDGVFKGKIRVTTFRRI